MNTTDQDVDLNEELELRVIEIQSQQKRSIKLGKHSEVHREFADNGYQLMLDLAKTVRAKFAEIDDVLDELLGSEGSVIQTELAAPILATLEIGREVCRKVRELGTAVVSEELSQLMLTYEAAAASVESEVADATVEPDVEEVEGEGDGEDDDEGESVEDDGGETQEVA